jgi:hypothetical protein
MAIAVGTVLRAYDFECVKGTPLTHTVSSNAVVVKKCNVDVQWVTGAYAQANDATFAPAAKILEMKRDGKAVTILQASPVDPGRFYVTATPTTITTPFALACANSGGTVTCALTGSDLTTELTDGLDLTTLTWTRPITFSVTYHESTD